MELIAGYFLCFLVRCLLFGPILWLAGKVTDTDIALKEACIVIAVAELIGLPFYMAGILSDWSTFYVLGYLVSLATFANLVIKATRANLIPDVILMLAVYCILRLLISF